MALNGLQADEQRRGDAGVRAAPCRQGHHTMFGRCQRIGSREVEPPRPRARRSELAARQPGERCRAEAYREIAALAEEPAGADAVAGLALSTTEVDEGPTPLEVSGRVLEDLDGLLQPRQAAPSRDHRAEQRNASAIGTGAPNRRASSRFSAESVVARSRRPSSISA